MKKILFLYKTPRKKIYEDWKKGIGPDTDLYGANHLEKLGYQVDFFDIGFSKLNPIWWISYPIFWLAAKTTGIGFNLSQALSLLPIINSYDAIVSTMDSAGLPFLFLKKWSIVKKPLIYISVDFINRLELNKNQWPYYLYKKYLKAADVVICYSKNEQQLFKKYNQKVTLLPVGCDFNFYSKRKHEKLSTSEKKTILAFGKDRDRDYGTFIEAIRNTDYKGLIVAGIESNLPKKFPKNISTFFDISPYKLRKIIQQSAAIVIPLKKVSRASGQLSFLAALAGGKPVIIANIAGVLAAYSPTDLKNCVFYKAENAPNLKTKIYRVLENLSLSKKLSRESIILARKYSTEKFALAVRGFLPRTNEK